MYKKGNTCAVSLLVIIAVVLFSSYIVNAKETEKTPKVMKVTCKCELFETITVTVDNLPEFLKQATGGVLLYRHAS